MGKQLICFEIRSFSKVEYCVARFRLWIIWGTLIEKKLGNLREDRKENRGDAPFVFVFFCEKAAIIYTQDSGCFVCHFCFLSHGNQCLISLPFLFLLISFGHVDCSLSPAKLQVLSSEIGTKIQLNKYLLPLLLLLLPSFKGFKTCFVPQTSLAI